MALVALSLVTPAASAAAEKKRKGLTSNLRNDGIIVKAVEKKAAWDVDLPAGAQWSDAQPVSSGPTWEYRETLGCGSTSNPDAPNDLSSCSLAISACPPVAGRAVNQLYLWRRIVGTTRWFFNGTTCGSANLPNTVSTPPPTPTLADILAAFRELPFGKPTVNIQPEGDVTLVNLPTYFEAQWPAGRLGPGDVSKPVQLLSWSVEFRIDPARYDFDFGDGSSSGWTTDRGGPHPDGGIRHTYDQSRPQAQVKVDATLTGSYRVGGGAWVPLDGLADLQDEPVTTLQVREAKARLQTS
ncbi:hypothetical protein [Knoellia flava]|uniref:hypothetical protein n=1 Tax=Knoellia flava TaxID=913969 RepID=UPI001E56C6FE|nr:hypothetical protein [Knoellia flava]